MHRLDNVTSSQYVLSVYFISTIFTTVGFGDVAALNEAEQVFCIVIMYMGTFIFGTLLSEVETVVEAARFYNRAKCRVKQQVQEYLRSKKVHRQLCDKILSWIDFNFEAQQDLVSYTECVSQIPKAHRLELLARLHSGRLLGHPVLGGMVGPKASVFLDELWGCFKVQTFAEGEVIASHTHDSNDEANRTYLLDRGAVNLVVQGSRVEQLQPGDYIGEMCMFGCTSWCVHMTLPFEFVANCNVCCFVVTRQEFYDLLCQYPSLRAEIELLTTKVYTGRRIKAGGDVDFNASLFPGANSSDESFHEAHRAMISPWEGTEQNSRNSINESKTFAEGLHALPQGAGTGMARQGVKRFVAKKRAPSFNHLCVGGMDSAGDRSSFGGMAGGGGDRSNLSKHLQSPEIEGIRGGGGVQLSGSVTPGYDDDAQVLL
jgi:hypothetical protein